MKITGCSFSQVPTFIAKAITWFTKGPSHVYMHVENYEGLYDIILHSTEGGIRKDTETNFIERHNHKIIAKVDFENAIDVTEFIQENLGKKYDTIGLLGNGMARVLSWISRGRWGKRNPWRNDLMVCSELANNLLKSTYVTDFDPNMVSPEELLRYMKEHPEHFDIH